MTTDAEVKAFEAFRRQKTREEKARAALEGADDEEMRLFLEWKAQKEQETSEKASIPRQSAPEYPYSETFGMDPRTTTPEPYKVNRAGVHVLQAFGQTQRWSQITYAPLVITKAYTDADGKKSVELAWTDRGKVVRRVVSREAVVRGRELIKSLGGDGLPVLEGDAREVERWLATFEAENVETIPTGYVARYLGWQPDGTFVSGPDGDTRVEVTYEEQKGAAAALWQRGVPASPNSRATPCPEWCSRPRSRLRCSGPWPCPRSPWTFPLGARAVRQPAFSAASPCGPTRAKTRERSPVGGQRSSALRNTSTSFVGWSAHWTRR